MEARAMCRDIKLFNFSKKWSREFMRAIEKVREGGKVSIEQLAEKANSNPDKLGTQGSYKDYLSNLENIFNINKSKRLVIY